MQYELLQGDCVETMRAMPDNSVDSIVTDPPYELGFMGKAWDASGIANNPVMWAEALRVLKPGGHLLAFSGSRTYHRMTCAIEDAGFEVRDQIMWVYGSGFPKSLDVSKAIDKARVEDVEPVRAVCRAVRAAMDAKGWKSRDLTPHFDNCHPRLIDHWAARDTDSQPSLPTTVQWEKLRELLALGGTHDSEVARLNGRKGDAGDVYQNAEVLGEHAGNVPGLGGERFGVADTSIRARSDAARQWEGWGTALKPAHEPICVARKPLIGTVAANVLAHGTGALNIDGCRVDGGARPLIIGQPKNGEFAGEFRQGSSHGGETTQGRWPANLIHDGSDEVLALFPGEDAGSAARFFYQAKCSKTDRNSGLNGLVEVIIEWNDSTTGEIKWGTEARQVKLWVATDQYPPRVTAVFGAPNKSVTEWNTMLSGSAPTGLSPQDSTCTISTKTSCTTSSEILSFFQSCITSESTADANCGTASGGSPAGNAASCSTLIFTTNGWMVSALGASRAVWPMRLKISANAATSGHPTVKPTELMAYLCRLVTPPGGLILDPFMGSGSTGKAAMREGFRFIGCELSAEYLAIAEARISHELIGDLV